MLPSAAQLRQIAKGKSVATNVDSIVEGLRIYGREAGLDRPHRLAHYLAQLAHESAGFRYDREIWGPTAAQKRYEGRADLGNTAPGDGEKFKGHGPIQITGKANTQAFRDWCRAKGLEAPDFVANPELINTDPWEGLGPIWYWETRGLNRLADVNDIENLTYKINGGRNGLEDRIDYYVRSSLVLLGYGPTDIEVFQRRAQQAGLLPADTPDAPQVDGVAGPITRGAMHKMLADLHPVTAITGVQAGPVVEETKVTVAPAGAEKVGISRFAGLLGLLGAPFAAFAELDFWSKVLVLGFGTTAVGFLIWRGEHIARQVKRALAQLDGAP